MAFPIPKQKVKKPHYISEPYGLPFELTEKDKFETENSKKTFEVPKKEDISIDRHNWSFELKNKKAKISLGNMSDTGWYWNGDEKDLVGYSYRLENSKVSDEFYKSMEHENVSFDKMKPLFLQSAKTKSGLYEISGDNVVWHFGEIGDYEVEVMQEEGFTETQRNKFYEQYTPITYEEFEEKYGKEYEAEVKKLIKSSHSFREFNQKLAELSQEYKEKVNNENVGRIHQTIDKIKFEEGQ